VPFFESVGVTDQDALVGWARSAEFRRDFQGRVKGLGYATFQWLTMRCGIETVKPDVHTRRFTQRCLGRPLTDSDIVELVTRAAKLLGMPARLLDLAIWNAKAASASWTAAPTPAANPSTVVNGRDAGPRAVTFVN